MKYSRRVRVVSLLSFPNCPSAEISLSNLMLPLGLELNEIQKKSKCGKITQFSQSRKPRDVLELLIVITRSGME
jgi:hypothetical protein